MPNQYVNKVVTSNGTTLIDLTGDTVTSSDHIMQGYVGHLADGSQVTGTGQGGGSSGQSETGTFTGNNGITVQIPCSFEPDLIRIYGDLSGAVSLRGIVSLTFIKNDSMYVFCDTSSSSSGDNAENAMYWILHDMVGFNDSSEPHASYANGVLTIDMVSNTSAFRFTSGIEYTYKFVKWTT